MKNGIESVFATPIYFAMIDNLDQVKKEFNEIKHELNYYDTPEMWGRPQKLTTQNFEDNIIENKKLNVINKVIDDNLKIFLQAINFPEKKYRVTSWITLNKKGHYTSS